MQPGPSPLVPDLVPAAKVGIQGRECSGKKNQNFPGYFFPISVNRYAPFGTVISNRAPLPGTPASVIVMPVMERISQG